MTMTIKATHTPGPWRYEPYTKTIRSQPSNYWLTTMDSWDGAVNNEANARLIAAAPEMLEALEQIQKWIECGPEVGKMPCAAIDAAIRKARGGQ